MPLYNSPCDALANCARLNWIERSRSRACYCLLTIVGVPLCSTRVIRLLLITIAFAAASSAVVARETYPFPYILTYSPTSGAPGTVITVTGTGFTGLNGAWIGTGHNSSVSVLSDSIVRVTVPEDATTGQLALLNSEYEAWSPNNFTVTHPATTGTPSTAAGTPSTGGTTSTPAAPKSTAAAGTPPATTATTTPTPAATTPTTAAASGTSWVYDNGVFGWPGDYSFSATPDYKDTSGNPLSGSYDIKVTLTGQWGGWLPYALNWDFNSTPYTKLTFALKPTVANQQWNVFFVKLGDVPVGIYIDPTLYGPAPVVGEWATYTIPLAVLGVQGDSIYKFCIHDETGLSSNVWYVDNVGFEP
jgi:hypothetical protein